MMRRFRNRGILIFGELIASLTAVVAAVLSFLEGETTTGTLALATAIGAGSLLVHAWRHELVEFVRYDTEEEALAADSDDGKYRYWPEK